MIIDETFAVLIKDIKIKNYIYSKGHFIKNLEPLNNNLYYADILFSDQKRIWTLPIYGLSKQDFVWLKF